MSEQSFLGELLKKESDMRRIADQTGKNLTPAIRESQRQRKQLENPITGEGVTKSR